MQRYLLLVSTIPLPTSSSATSSFPKFLTRLDTHMCNNFTHDTMLAYSIPTYGYTSASPTSTSTCTSTKWTRGTRLALMTKLCRRTIGKSDDMNKNQAQRIDELMKQIIQTTPRPLISIIFYHDGSMTFPHDPSHPSHDLYQALQSTRTYDAHITIVTDVVTSTSTNIDGKEDITSPSHEYISILHTWSQHLHAPLYHIHTKRIDDIFDTTCIWRGCIHVDDMTSSLAPLHDLFIALTPKTSTAKTMLTHVTHLIATSIVSRTSLTSQLTDTCMNMTICYVPPHIMPILQEIPTTSMIVMKTATATSTDTTTSSSSSSRLAVERRLDGTYMMYLLTEEMKDENKTIPMEVTVESKQETQTETKDDVPVSNSKSKKRSRASASTTNADVDSTSTSTSTSTSASTNPFISPPRRVTRSSVTPSPSPSRRVTRSSVTPPTTTASQSQKQTITKAKDVKISRGKGKVHTESDKENENIDLNSDIHSTGSRKRKRAGAITTASASTFTSATMPSKNTTSLWDFPNTPSTVAATTSISTSSNKRKSREPPPSRPSTLSRNSIDKVVPASATTSAATKVSTPATSGAAKSESVETSSQRKPPVASVTSPQKIEPAITAPAPFIPPPSSAFNALLSRHQRDAEKHARRQQRLLQQQQQQQQSNPVSPASSLSSRTAILAVPPNSVAASPSQSHPSTASPVPISRVRRLLSLFDRTTGRPLSEVDVGMTSHDDDKMNLIMSQTHNDPPNESMQDDGNIWYHGVLPHGNSPFNVNHPHAQPSDDTDCIVHGYDIATNESIAHDHVQSIAIEHDNVRMIIPSYENSSFAPYDDEPFIPKSSRPASSSSRRSDVDATALLDSARREAAQRSTSFSSQSHIIGTPHSSIGTPRSATSTIHSLPSRVRPPSHGTRQFTFIKSRSTSTSTSTRPPLSGLSAAQVNARAIDTTSNIRPTEAHKRSSSTATRTSHDVSATRTHDVSATRTSHTSSQLNSIERDNRTRLKEALKTQMINIVKKEEMPTGHYWDVVQTVWRMLVPLYIKAHPRHRIERIDDSILHAFLQRQLRAKVHDADMLEQKYWRLSSNIIKTTAVTKKRSTSALETKTEKVAATMPRSTTRAADPDATPSA